MKPKFLCYFILILFAAGFIACGSGSDADEKSDRPQQPPTQTPRLNGGGSTPPPVQGIDFAVEEVEIRAVLAKHAEGISKRELDDIMPNWLKNEGNDVFVAWVFEPPAFQQHFGWKAIRNGWEGVFKLIKGDNRGDMTVDVTSVEIDARAQTARVRAAYTWAAKSKLIAAMKKNNNGEWKISAVDYTQGGRGELIKDLKNPAYKNPPG